MKIILEGPDGAGKSTLAATLSDEHDIPVRHYSADFESYPKQFKEATSLPKGDLILDRFHLSEQVYAGVYRKGTIIGSQIRILERVLKTKNAVVVLCLPPKEVCLENWQDNVDQEMYSEGMDKVWDMYAKIQTALPWIRYDYTQDTPGWLWGYLNDMYRENESSVSPKVDIQLFGWKKPGNILIVGDKVIHPDQREVPFSRDIMGCSPWFCDLLEQARIPEDQLCWGNARDYHGCLNSTAPLYDLQPSWVLALGMEAKTWVTRQHPDYFKKSGVNVEFFEHPQYHKRFHYHEPYPLIARLQELTQ